MLTVHQNPHGDAAHLEKMKEKLIDISLEAGAEDLDEDPSTSSIRVSPELDTKEGREERGRRERSSL